MEHHAVYDEILKCFKLKFLVHTLHVASILCHTDVCIFASLSNFCLHFNMFSFMDIDKLGPLGL